MTQALVPYTDTVAEFRASIAAAQQRLVELSDRGYSAPPKVLRFMRMYQAGLPLDPTVRYYPACDIQAIVRRVAALSAANKEVWIGTAFPQDQAKAPLFKGIKNHNGVLAIDVLRE